MAETTAVYVIGNAAPTFIAGPARGWLRKAVLQNVGTARLWTGDSNVYPGQGRVLDPGTDAIHEGDNELWAIALSPTVVLVNESLD